MSDFDLTAFAQQALSAVQSGNWRMVAMLVVMMVVYLLRRFGPSKWPWLKSDAGGAVLALGAGFVGSLVNAVAAHSALSLQLLLTALQVAVGAAGGWSLLMKLLPASWKAALKGPATPPPPPAEATK